LSLLPSIVLFHPTRVVQKMFFQSLAYCIKSRSQVNRLVRCLEYSCLPDDDFGLHLPLSCITLQPPLMAILVEANVRDAEKIHTTALRRSNCAKKKTRERKKREDPRPGICYRSMVYARSGRTAFTRLWRRVLLFNGATRSGARQCGLQRLLSTDVVNRVEVLAKQRSVMKFAPSI